MSAPYLNRGESIILTTHRVSAGSVTYDLLLTNERLILMDSRYTRFEPRMILFPAISSVKGGKVPTGEPVIILLLDEPDSVNGSAQVDLIFTQQPGEQRKEERELWVRKIIELVIAARERAMQKPVPRQEKTGLHPTVRRFVAPDPARPHSTTRESEPKTRRIIATPDETDLPVFNRKDLPQVPEILPSNEDMPKEPDEEPILTTPAAPIESKPEGTILAPTEEPPEDVNNPEFPPVPEDHVLELLYEETEEIPAANAQSENLPNPFAGTVRTALQSLKSGSTEKELPETRTLSKEDSKEIDIQETVADNPLAQEEGQIVQDDGYGDRAKPDLRDFRGETVQAVPELHQDPGSGNDLEAPEPVAEIPDIPPLPASTPVETEPARPETYAVDNAGPKHEKTGTPTPGTPFPPTPKGAQEPDLPTRQIKTNGIARSPTAGAKIPATIIVVLIALLALSGGILILFYYVPGNSGNGGSPEEVVPPAITIPPAVTTVTPATPPLGVHVEVSYPGVFTGTVGNPGFLHQVSGTGNRTFSILMTSGIVQATIRKQDNSGDSLIVRIYDNSTLLAQQTVTAPGGEVNLLIDTKTSSAPGMIPDAIPDGEITRSGNATLIYY